MYLFPCYSLNPSLLLPCHVQESVLYVCISIHGLVTHLRLWFISHSCSPMDCSPPGSSVHGISQVRILEWVAISFSRGSSRPWDQTCISCVTVGLLHCWWILYQLRHQGSPLHLHCCPANRFISSIFLDSIYVCNLSLYV